MILKILLKKPRVVYVKCLLQNTRAATDKDHDRIAALSGNHVDIDTPLEIALLSNSVGVIDVRPVEANQMLGTPRQADLKLASALLMETMVLRFLGNTRAVCKHECELKFIVDKGNVTRADVEAFYRNGIRALVSNTIDEEFKKTRGGYAPYSVYVNSGHRNIIDAIKDIITAFFIDPNTNTYLAICAVIKYFGDQFSRGITFAGHTGSAVADAIKNLSSELFDKINRENLNRLVIPTSVQNNPAVREATRTISMEDFLKAIEAR